MTKFLPFLFFIFLSLFADPPPISYPCSQQNHLAFFSPKTPLKGILLVGSLEKNSDFFQKEGILCQKIQIPGKEKDLNQRLTRYLKKGITKELIKKIKDEIIAYYQSCRHPIVAVWTDDQDLSKGFLKINVIEGKIGKVVVKGNQWVSEKAIRKEINLDVGDPIDESLLEQDIYWLNRLPFQQSYIQYTPGEKEGTTDVEIVVKDQRPYHGYIGNDNIGNDITGNYRFFLGFNVGNLFKNQFLSYQFTSDNEFKRFLSHSLYYKAPLPWRNELILFGGYSSVDCHFHVHPDPVLFHTKGFSLQTSLRYTIPLGPWKKNILADTTWGYDFKRTNNALNYGVVPLFPDGHYANLTQFMLGFNIGYTKNISLSFEIESFFSPWKWISDQSDADYNSIRWKAKSRYYYVRSSFSLIYPFSNFRLKQYLRWQLSSQNLLPSEQYGLGGFETIRGYKEREVNVDDALVYNLELHFPTKSIFFKRHMKTEDQFDIFAFADLGYGAKNIKAPGEKKDYFLASIGPGVHYTIAPYLSSKAEYGIQINHLGSSGLGKPHHRLHFSLIAGF